MELVCSLTVLGDLPVLQASGEIDLATLPYFHDQLNRAISLHVGAEVFVDLDGVTALDDTGIGMLLGAAGRAREHGGDLLLVCNSDRLRIRGSPSPGWIAPWWCKHASGAPRHHAGERNGTSIGATRKVREELTGSRNRLL